MKVTLLQSSPPENTRDSTRVFVISGVTSCNIGVSYFLMSYVLIHIAGR